MSQTQRKALAAEGQLRAVRDLRLIEAYRAGSAPRRSISSLQATKQRCTACSPVSTCPPPTSKITQEIFLPSSGIQRFCGQLSFQYVVGPDHHQRIFRSQQETQTRRRALEPIGVALVDVSDQRPYSDDPFRAT